MASIHKTHQWIVNPPHRFTACLVGCGGNGVRMLLQLARINMLLSNLGHPGFALTVYDPKDVTEACRGRQAFCQSDVGSNKAITAVTRINRMFGYDWEAKPRAFTGSMDDSFNIIISCVDNSKARKTIMTMTQNAYQEWVPVYWMDLGNGAYHGQFVIGSFDKSLPFVHQIFPEILEDHPDEPSCSMVESITKQSPFINTILTDFAAMFLYNMITELQTDHQGMVINIKENIYNKIPIR